MYDFNFIVMLLLLLVPLFLMLAHIVIKSRRLQPVPIKKRKQVVKLSDYRGKKRKR